MWSSHKCGIFLFFVRHVASSYHFYSSESSPTIVFSLLNLIRLLMLPRNHKLQTLPSWRLRHSRKFTQFIKTYKDCYKALTPDIPSVSDIQTSPNRKLCHISVYTFFIVKQDICLNPFIISLRLCDVSVIQVPMNKLLL